MQLYVVLPAYNERENLEPLLADLESVQARLDHPLHVILADDGSQDGSAEIARGFETRLDLKIIVHEKNMGFSEALRTGLKSALQWSRERRPGPDDAVLVMDADNSHPADLIFSMTGRLKKGYDVVIASRYAPGGKQVGVPRLRMFLSRACGWIFKSFFSLENVRDYTSSFRMIRLKSLENLAGKTDGRFYSEQGFVCACELLFNLKRVGARFTEVPMILRYDRKKGRSKMNVLKTIADYLGWMLRMKVRTTEGW